MDLESSYEIFDAAIKQALKQYWNMQCYEDLYQECYMKILYVLKHNTYEPVLKLYGYAYKIARNAISTYLYHASKLTTLTSEEFPEIPVTDDFDMNLILDDAATYVMYQFQNIIPKDFTKEDLINLLEVDNPSSLLLTVLKGELIWRIAKPESMELPEEAKIK